MPLAPSQLNLPQTLPRKKVVALRQGIGYWVAVPLLALALGWLTLAWLIDAFMKPHTP